MNNVSKGIYELWETFKFSEQLRKSWLNLDTMDACSLSDNWDDYNLWHELFTKRTMSQITEDTSHCELLIISLELSPLNYIGPGLSSFMHILLYIVRSVHVLQ